MNEETKYIVDGTVLQILTHKALVQWDGGSGVVDLGQIEKVAEGDLVKIVIEIKKNKQHLPVKIYKDYTPSGF